MCYRCHGYTIRERFEDHQAGLAPMEGYKCVNCGACGDLPNASWKRGGVQIPPFVLQVGGRA